MHILQIPHRAGLGLVRLYGWFCGADDVSTIIAANNGRALQVYIGYSILTNKLVSRVPRTRLVKCGVAAGLSLGLDNPESRTAVRFDNMP